MSIDGVPNEGRFLSEANHDDLFDVMKSTMSKDVAVLPRHLPRRAMLKGVFISGLAFGIGVTSLDRWPLSTPEARRFHAFSL